MPKPLQLFLERKDQENKTGVLGEVGLLSPMVDEDYWAYRVRLSEGQAILGFPKYGTVGIGFAVEEDWNTNLPYTCAAQEIYDHIKHNAGGPLLESDVLAAIKMVQRAAEEDRS